MCGSETLWDHPRMRGEDKKLKLSASLNKGSPPHARGRRCVENEDDVAIGITPACAGKTPDPTRPYISITDHPRMRGEDMTGTSPASMALWITPACAGKTATPIDRLLVGSDHPRMRGEDSAALCAMAAIAGSPPHARGRLTGSAAKPTSPGITPACAGKTYRDEYPGRAFQDHPRMRGEDGGDRVG